MNSETARPIAAGDRAEASAAGVISGTERAALAGRVKTLRSAIGIDTEFSHEYRLLRPYLPDLVRDWPEEMALHVLRHSDVDSGAGAELGEKQIATMRRMTAAICTGRYFEDYYHAVTELTRQFLAAGVTPDELAGCLLAQFQDAQLRLFFMTRARDGRVFISALRCLFKIMALTLQIANHAANESRVSRQVREI